MTTTLHRLHERFIEKAQRPMDFGALPVRTREPHVPVIAIDRWREVEGALYKTYRFRREEDRADFVTLLLAHEAQAAHHAQIKVDEGEVELRLTTKDVDRVTERDKEYARYADLLFRELVYSPRDGDEA